MQQDFSVKPGNGGKRARFGIFPLLIMIITAVVLAAGINAWRASAAVEANDAQATADGSAGDFTIAFMDSPVSGIVPVPTNFNIRAGGFDSDSDKRFDEIGVAGTADDGHQLAPDIAAAANGDFVVVWADDGDKNGAYQIHARGFYSDGTERFARKTVNTTAKGDQINPVIAMTPAGDFVVAWQDDQDGNDLFEIHARGFNSDGEERFATKTVNSDSRGDQIDPAIAMAPNGDFVVTWENDVDPDGLYNIFARGFHSDGSERFAQVLVNLTRKGDQRNPDIAMAPNGEFAITWQDDQDFNDVFQIHARGFDSDGEERFATKTVNSVASGDQVGPYIGMADNGDFVVTWTDDQDGNGVNQVMARGFYDDGSERIPDFFVNSVGAGEQIVTDIAMDGRGNFVIPWMDDQDGNSVMQILAAGFNSDGSRRFPDFTVNEKAAGQQWLAAIAMPKKAPAVYLPFVQ